MFEPAFLSTAITFSLLKVLAGHITFMILCFVPDKVTFCFKLVLTIKTVKGWIMRYSSGVFMDVPAFFSTEETLSLFIVSTFLIEWKLLFSVFH